MTTQTMVNLTMVMVLQQREAEMLILTNKLDLFRVSLQIVSWRTISPRLTRLSSKRAPGLPQFASRVNQICSKPLLLLIG